MRQAPQLNWFGRELRSAAVLALASCLCAPGDAEAAGSSLEMGDILTANYYGNKVVKIDPATGIQQSLGIFTAPMDLALAATGDLYVGELGGDIKRLTIQELKAKIRVPSIPIYQLPPAIVVHAGPKTLGLGFFVS